MEYTVLTKPLRTEDQLARPKNVRSTPESENTRHSEYIFTVHIHQCSKYHNSGILSPMIANDTSLKPLKKAFQ